MRKLFYYPIIFLKHKLFLSVFWMKTKLEFFGEVFILFWGVNSSSFFNFLENLAKFFGIKILRKKRKTLINVNIHKHQENLQKIGEMSFFLV